MYFEEYCNIVFMYLDESIPLKSKNVSFTKRNSLSMSKSPNPVSKCLMRNYYRSKKSSQSCTPAIWGNLNWDCENYRAVRDSSPEVFAMPATSEAAKRYSLNQKLTEITLDTFGKWPWVERKARQNSKSRAWSASPWASYSTDALRSTIPHV